MFPTNPNLCFLLQAPSPTLIALNLILDFSFEHLLDAERPVTLHACHPASHKPVRLKVTYRACNEHEPNTTTFVARLNCPIATAFDFPLSYSSDERESSWRLL
jgi:hypothetical protein